MISAEEILKVSNYLLSKKLPLDILMEVEDHFLAQISELMEKDFLDFETAFSKVKILWSKELSFPKYNIQFNLNDTTYFVRKINNDLFWSVMKKSLMYSILFLLVFLMPCYMISVESFGYFGLIFLILIFTLPLINYLKHRKDFKLVKQYDNYILTFYQNYVVLAVSGMSFFIQILLRFKNTISYLLFEFTNGNFSWIALIGVFGCFGFIFCSVFTILSQKKYLHQINIVKPYLKYLRASS